MVKFLYRSKMPEDQQRPPSDATPPTGGTGQSSNSTPPARPPQSNPAPTTPPAKADGIHFHVRTLKTDLEAGASQERTVDLHRVTPKAEEITLPPDLSVNLSPNLGEAKKSPGQPPTPTPSFQNLPTPKIIFPQAGSANPLRVSQTPPPQPTPPPQLVDPIKPKIPAQPSQAEPPIFNLNEPEPFATALDRAIASQITSTERPNSPQPPLASSSGIKFEQSDHRPFSLIRNFRLIYLLPLVVLLLVLGGFGLWRQQSAPSAPVVPPPPAQPAEEPLFVPPTGELTEPLPIPVVTAGETATSVGLVAGTVISSTTPRVISAAPAPPTSRQLELTPPITTTAEEPKSPRPTEPVLGTQREIQPRLIQPKVIATPTTSPQPISGKTPAALLLDLLGVEVAVSALTTAGFQQAWATAIASQRRAGSLVAIHFTFQGDRLPLDFVLRSLATPNFIEAKYVQNFIGALGPNYELILYYTHTRKFPLIVFDVRDELTVVPFMRLWDKESLLDDVVEFYRGLSKGKYVRKFLVTKTLAGADYRIAYRDDDYKLIWLVYNGKMIISTTLSGSQILLDQLRLTE